MRTVRFTEPAELELNEAVAYYDNRVPGLGESFIRHIEIAENELIHHPERWPAIRRGIRRRFLGRFPYALYYRIADDEILVLAVAHLKRRPLYWLPRMRRTDS